jgi:hypothetical protein
MDFATFNIQKIKSQSELRARYKHNRRIEISSNIIADQIQYDTYQGNDIDKRIRLRIKEINKERDNLNGNRLRKDSIPAVEIVLGASHDFFNDRDDDFLDDWAQTQLDWAKDYYKGRGKIAGWDFHRHSEKTPHIHIIFIPETEKLDKRTGNMMPTLSAKVFVGNKSEMNRARTAHAEANQEYGLERGRNYHKEGEKPPQNLTLKQLRRLTANEVDELELIEGLWNLDILDNLNITRKPRRRGLIQNMDKVDEEH